MRYTVQPVQEFPCLYGDAQVEPPLPLTQVGVSSLVRGIRRPSTRRISPVWSVLACTGHPNAADYLATGQRECPRLYGASFQKGWQWCSDAGVSSLVRGIPYPNRCKTKVLQH